MAEEPIRKYQPVRRASIVPVSSAAPEAPVMVAPGAPTMESPVSQASREREARVRKQFEDIEAQYGRHGDVRSRRAEMRMSEAPETPVTDAYAIQMRPRIPVAGVPLEPLVIAKEQRKREEWISAEAVRAATLPHELQRDIQVAAYHRQMAEYNRQMNEYHKAVAEQRALDTEAQKYGHATHESLMQAIQEEKLIKRLNELGGVLTDVQLEAQRAAREGVPQSDYLATLESQRAEAERLQRSLQASFGVDVPATGYIAEVESVMAARDVAPVTMRTMAAPTPAAPYQVTIFPDLKFTTDTVPPYREPVPSDPVEQIFYHHAPIIDKFRADTRLDTPAIDIALASASLSRAAAGRPSPIVAPIAEQLIREPTRPVSALVEMPGELALGLYRIPTVAVPHYTAHPEELPGLPGKIISGVGEEFVSDPAGFSTKFVGMGYLSGPAISAVRPATTPITAGIREFSIVARTAPEMRPFVRGTSRIGRYSEGVYSTVQEAPVLSAAANVGDRAGVIMDALKGEPHAFYGSIVETGQMPRTVTLQRTGRTYTPTPSDVDVFVSRPIEMAESVAARMGPGYSVEGATVVREVRPGLTAHAVDIHAFPPGYPGAPRATGPAIVPAGSEVIQAPRLPFDFMPKELLEVGGTTQEHLYTQVQRKATSIIGQPKGIFGWEAGPPAHRTKDIASTLIDTDYLIMAGEARAAELTGIQRVLAERRIRKLKEGYAMLAGTEAAQTALAEAKGLSVGGVAPPVLAPPSPIVSPTATGPGTSMLIRSLSPTVRSPVTRVASPTVTSPGVRSPIVRAVSPVVSRVSPTVASPTMSPGISPVVTVGSPTVASPGIRSPIVKIGSHAVTVGSPTVTSPGIRSPTIRSPIVRGPTPPQLPRPRRMPDADADKRHRYPWDEWFISYRDAPTPHKGFEGVYLGLPDVARPGPVTIKGLQRVTVGPAPARTVRPTIKRGKPLRIGKKRLF